MRGHGSCPWRAGLQSKGSTVRLIPAQTGLKRRAVARELRHVLPHAPHFISAFLVLRCSSCGAAVKSSVRSWVDQRSQRRAPDRTSRGTAHSLTKQGRLTPAAARIVTMRANVAVRVVRAATGRVGAAANLHVLGPVMLRPMRICRPALKPASAVRRQPYAADRGQVSREFSFLFLKVAAVDARNALLRCGGMSNPDFGLPAVATVTNGDYRWRAPNFKSGLAAYIHQSRGCLRARSGHQAVVTVEICATARAPKHRYPLVKGGQERSSMGSLFLCTHVLILHLAVPSRQCSMIAFVSCTSSTAGTWQTGRRSCESHMQSRAGLWLIGLVLWAAMRSDLCFGTLPAPLRSAGFICRTKQKSQGRTTSSSGGPAKAEQLIQKATMATPAALLRAVLVTGSSSRAEAQLVTGRSPASHGQKPS